MTQLQEQQRTSEELAVAADRVREWFGRRLDEQSLDIARLYRGSRDRFVARIRAAYEAFLGEAPTLGRARATGAGAALDAAIHDTVDGLARELGELAVDRVETTLGSQGAVAQRELGRATGLSFRDLPVTTQGVLNELTTTVVGGGTFFDRILHQSEQFRAGLFGTVRQSLLSGEDFWALRDKVHKFFGVDKLAEPRGPAYDSVKVYRNEALRQWNLTMGEQACAADAVEVWMTKLDERTTPGCAARHGRRIEDIGERPPRHYNCRCQVLPIPPDADFAAFRAEADAWLSEHGYTRRQAAQMEAQREMSEVWDPAKHPRDKAGKFSSSSERAAQKEFHTQIAAYPGGLPVYHETPAENADVIQQQGIRGESVFATIGTPSGFVVKGPKAIVHAVIPRWALDSVGPDMRYDPDNPHADLLAQHGGKVHGADVSINRNIPRGWIRSVRRVETEVLEAWDPTLHPRDETGRFSFKGQSVARFSHATPGEFPEHEGSPGTHLYHTTSVDNLDDVTANGLRPHGPSYRGEQDSWPNGGREPRTYFSTQPGGAQIFSEPDHVLLRVPTEHARGKGLKVEFEGRDYYVSRKTIPPHQIEVLLHDGTWAPLTSRKREAEAGLFIIASRGALPQGWILAAPHANDAGTQALARATGGRLGVTTIQPVPEAFPETGPQRLNINRPTRGEKVDVETTDPEAQAVWQEYRNALLQAAGGTVRLYVELHSNEAPETAFAVEIATVGITAAQARGIKAALRGAFDQPYEVRVEPIDQLRWTGQIAKAVGAFSLAERGLQIEFPQGLVERLNSYAELAERWFAGLRGALVATGARTQEAGWAWGAERLVPLYLARRLPSYPGRYVSVPWRELPRVYEGAAALPWCATCPEAIATGAPDHVLLRRAGRGLEVLAETGWRPVRANGRRPVDWIEVSAGYALDSPEAPAWEARAVRLPQEIIQRWPAMRTVMFPAVLPREQYAVRIASAEEAAALTLRQAFGAGAWVLGQEFGVVVREFLTAYSVPTNPVLVVAIIEADLNPHWEMIRDALRTAIYLDTGQALYARDPFPPGLEAPYRRVAVVAFEPEAEVVGPVGVDPAGPTGVWAIRPRGRPFWSLPGGHLNPGEAPAEAAAREIWEEAGLRVHIVRSLGELYRPWATTEVFLAHRTEPVQAPSKAEEIDAVAVVQLENLEPGERAFLARRLPRHFPLEVVR